MTSVLLHVLQIIWQVSVHIFYFINYLLHTQECYILLYLLQAGSTLTKVKLIVVDTTNPSRRTQVVPPASVASGSVYIFFSLKHDSNQTEANTISSCSVSCENLVTFCCLLLSDHILCSVTWPTDERVAVQWLTRKQNYVIVQIYDFDGSSWKEKQVAVTSLVTYLVRKSQAVLN